ncbi:hypothetical protein OU798_19310 [Prolixibacteraceae bacterium Z1-6]|uniref:Lipocalin-like domain-containing protein n=1 Tax=Draconibacterium aestuarii TaxID=2998507 RepID=A0A9X3FA59_9BACT|nr:hypothetical protein [Prolixibacteraceae bacterium Z1-6]
MKTLKLLVLLVVMSAFISSCQSDENTGVPKQITTVYTYKGLLRNLEGVNGELVFNDFKLADIIGEDPAKNLESGEMQVASCSIEIEGLKNIEMPDGEEAILNNFTVTVGSNSPVLLGNCMVEPNAANEFASDIPQSTAKFIGVISDIFSDLTKGTKNTALKVSFTPNVDITASSGVYLKIVIGGTYYYIEFE